jgi:hypothetical protein
MAVDTVTPGTPVLISSTNDVVTTRNGTLIGFYVASTSSGTIVLRQGGSGGAAISGTITPAVGWHDFPAAFVAGLHATVGGTISVTFFVI